MIKKLLLIFIQLPIVSVAQDNLQFIGEKIDFNINYSRFSTNGIYIFVNNTEHEIRQTILFPFSQEADSVSIKRVYNLSYAQNIQFKQNDNSILFPINIFSKDTVKLNISYTQKTSIENIYILESTQAWNKPLQKAEYSLTCDDTVVIDSLSLKQDTIVGNVYYWTKTDFYPTDDFKITIKK